MATIPTVVGAVRAVPARPKFDFQTEPAKLRSKLEYRKADLTKRGVRVITGAERVWATPAGQNTIFIRNLRLVGNQEELVAFLTQAGLPGNQLQAMFVDNNMYTFANTRLGSSQRVAYEAEVAEKKAANEARRSRAKLTLDWLEPIVEGLKKVKVSAPARATPSPGRRGRGRTLSEHLQELSGKVSSTGEPKVLDVTGWDNLSDKGARKKDRP